MKIGFVLDDSFDSNDGVQQYVRTLGKWLIGKGHIVQYLAGQSHASKNVHSLAKNIKVKFNGNSFSIPLPMMAKKIQAILAKEQFDVLHVQMPYSPALAGKIIKNTLPGTAVVGTFHIMPYRRSQAIGNKMLGRLQRKSLKLFDSICFVSPAARLFARKAYGIDGQVIPNMIDISKWKNNVKKIPGRVVFLGRLVPRKGCKEMLQTFAALPEPIRVKLEIIVAGDGPERKSLEKLARNLQLVVSFRGYISEVEKPNLLASAEIAVFPSLGGESFGIVLLEAMAAGAEVVIGGENPGYRSVLQKVPECLVDFKTTETAVPKIIALLTNSKLRRSLHNDQQQIIVGYDVNRVGAKVESMYATVIAKHDKRRDNEPYVE